MSEREGDRITLGFTWPTRVQYSTIRVEMAHTFAPNEDRDAAIDRMADDLARIVDREMDRILAILKPERPALGPSQPRTPTIGPAQPSTPNDRRY